MSTGTPPAEADIDLDLVRCLIESQLPELAGLGLGDETDGWDNVVFRLGDDLAVRLPRRTTAVELAVKEHRWLNTITRGLPVAVPEVVRVGKPGCGYPWPWSVVRWVDGHPLDQTPVDGDQLAVWGDVLSTLHSEAPPDAPINPVRGQRLRPQVIESRLTDLELDEAAAGRMVNLVREASELALPRPSWIHGDPHPRNVLARDGRIVGVIDWGDLTAGDPACDLASLWLLFPDADHGPAFAAYGPIDDETTKRSLAWAAHLGVMLSKIHDDRRHVSAGRAALRRVLEDLAG